MSSCNSNDMLVYVMLGFLMGALISGVFIGMHIGRNTATTSLRDIERIGERL